MLLAINVQLGSLQRRIQALMRQKVQSQQTKGSSIPFFHHVNCGCTACATATFCDCSQCTKERQQCIQSVRVQVNGGRRCSHCSTTGCPHLFCCKCRNNFMHTSLGSSLASPILIPTPTSPSDPRLCACGARK